MPVRDVDSLEAVPDDKLRRDAQNYLEKHGVQQMLKDLLEDILQRKPADPAQFMIDSLTLGPEEAVQDPRNGLPQHRQRKLSEIFNKIVKDGSGQLTLRRLQEFAGRHGGVALGQEQLASIFRDFKPADETHVSLGHLNTLYPHAGEFLAFFSKASRTLSNAKFDDMIAEMST